MDEAKERDLTKYSNLSELFCRELAPGLRPIDKSAFIVSYCSFVENYFILASVYNANEKYLRDHHVLIPMKSGVTSFYITSTFSNF